jgi:Na+/H+ antiporter NhaC
MSIFLFVTLMGGFIALLIRAGGSIAFGIWASGKVKSKRSAQLLTALMGLVIFIDDYFNCLAVGTVMRPLTDHYRVSREKFTYFIDATTAPICIIAPVSTWVGAIISNYPETAGVSAMQAFISSIPMNLYALLTIFMVFWLALRKNSDYGPMAAAEKRTEETGFLGNEALTSQGGDNDLEKYPISDKGKMFDLFIPVAALLIFSVAAMLWTGGYWNGEDVSIFDAFGETDAGLSFSLGSFAALIVVFFMYIPRKLIGLGDFFDTLGAGIKSMVPAIVILTLAWTLSGICIDLLGTSDYVAAFVESSSLPVQLIPVLLYIITAVFSFATNSWGAFALLIPIGITICELVAPQLSIVTLAAILAGAVLGDHCSPLSDTTAVSSISARCNLIDHVVTQLPYGFTVGAVCIVGYLVSGFTVSLGYGLNIIIMLLVSFALLIPALLVLPKVWKNRS